MNPKEGLNLGEFVVCECINSIKDVANIEQCHFFFDNFFTSHKLLLSLKKNNTKAKGACRRNHTGSCVLVEDKKLLNRGDYNS